MNIERRIFEVYDFYDFKQFVGMGFNFMQTKIICEKYIDETDGECILGIIDRNSGREFSYNEFLGRYFAMKTIKQIFEEMNETIKKFDRETKAIFEEWQEKNKQIIDNYKKSVYDIEQRHKDFMLKIGGKTK